MKILAATIFLLILFLAACDTYRPPSGPSEIGGGQRDPDCVCIALYAPVCGSNGKTYGNSCEAGCWGITRFTEGECK